MILPLLKNEYQFQVLDALADNQKIYKSTKTIYSYTEKIKRFLIRALKESLI